jgi:CheY-like chemotaxis protein
MEKSAIIHVLVVDDSAAFRKLITKLIERSPFIEVTAIAGGGREALDVLQRSNVDIVVVDLMMPDGDGILVLRSIEHTQTRAILVTSADINSSEVESAKRAGAFAVMQKPHDPEDAVRFGRELIVTIKRAAAR